MRRSFLDEQAGFLARELQPGKPCPVCGAIEHPNPCIASTLHRDLTREQLELAEKEVSELRNRQEQSAGEARSAVDIVAEKERLLEETGRKLCTRILNDHEQFPEAGMVEVFDSLGDNIKNFQESRNSEVPGAAQDQMADKECNWNALLKQIQTLLGTWKTLLQEEGTRLNTAQKTLRNLQDALGQVEERKKSGKTAVEECGQKLTEAAASAKSAEALLESYKTQRRLTHEFTNHTEALALLLQQGDYEGAKAYLSTLTKTIAANTTIMNTHNPLLDALLSKKYEEASRKGVMVYFDLPDLRDMPMDQTDLVIVLSNLLNNAIEAAAQADPPEVYVRMRKSEEEVVLSVRNRVKKDLNLVDGQLPRISQKGAGHGFGLWNVQDVLKKYGGEYTISCRGCWFRFTCTIPLRKL